MDRLTVSVVRMRENWMCEILNTVQSRDGFRFSFFFFLRFT